MQRKRQEQGNRTGEKRWGGDTTAEEPTQKAILDRRTQQKRPQEGTAAEGSQDKSPRQRQRKDRQSQHKRAAEDDSDGEVQRHGHRRETQRGHMGAREGTEEDEDTTRKKSSNTKVATRTSEQELD
jgi:hypothetical protein